MMDVDDELESYQATEPEWDEEPRELADQDLPLEVSDASDFTFDDDRPYPVFTQGLVRQAGFAKLERDNVLAAYLSQDIDEDLKAQRLVPVVIGTRIVALCFQRRRHRHTHA